MIGELDVAGVFLSPVLISAVLALVVYIVVKMILSRVGAYRFIWHPALFDSALFVIVWGIVASFPLPQV
jgi:hypothetical protein